MDEDNKMYLYCKHIHSFAESLNKKKISIETFHGNDNFIMMKCGKCDKKFQVGLDDIQDLQSFYSKGK